MAWLHAIPQPPEGTARAKSALRNTVSRIARLQREGVELEMPPNPLPHLVARFIEIGMTEATGMGPAPLSWREIDAWQRNTGVRLSPWEARLIRRLSLEYLGQLGRSESENCPAPWRGRVTESEVEAELAALVRVLG